MKRILTFFITNYKLSLTLTIFMMIAGTMGLMKVRRESRPPVDFARATVVTIYPGSSPEEVEERITKKLEDEIREVEGLKDVTSISQAGRSKIDVRVDMDNVDTDKVMDELQRAVQRVQDLPSDVLEDPLFTRINAKEIPVIELALIGSNRNRRRDELADRFKEILEDEDGVAEVRLSGFREREFQILLDPDKLRQYHVGISEVVESVRRRTQDIPAGTLRMPKNQQLVRVTGQVESAKEMANIVVRSNFSGQQINIRDIAEVRDGMEDTSVKVRVNGEPATLLTVTKKATADAIRVVSALEETMTEFNEKLPEGYKTITYDDEAERIEDRLSIVASNALTGLALVLVILLIFLPGILGFMASISLPLALFGSLALMPSMGVNFNTITMLALIIAIGMLVDNAVVISENYARLRLEGLERRQAAIKAVHQFWLPIAATAATTISAFLPMLVTKGVMGEFIKWIPIMVSIALAMSLIEAFFLLPARLQFTVRSLSKYQSAESGHSRTWFDGIRETFESFMNMAVRLRYLVFIVIGLVLGGSIVLAIKGNRFELFPTEEVEFYFGKFEAPVTTTLEDMDDMAGRLVDDILDKLGRDTVEYAISRAGVSRVGLNDPNEKNGDYVGMVTVAIPRDLAKKQNPQEMLKKLRSIPKGRLTELNFEASQGGPPVGKAMQVSFRSNDYPQLTGMIEKFKEKLRPIDGLVDLSDDEIEGGPEYRVIPDHGALSRLNLSTEAVGMALRTALQGAIASELNMDGEDFYLRVRYDDKERATLQSLRETHIMEPSGKLIPLMSLVKMKQETGPAVRKHFNFKRSITVSSGVVPEKITAVELNKKAREHVNSLSADFPKVTTEFGGEDESTRESLSSLFQAMVLALLGIFIILVFLFRSFLTPLLVLSGIPLGLVGVSWAFYFHDRPLSFIALIGVVGLAGVVVNSAIVLVSYIEEMREETNLSLREILAKASSHRLRAVLVTGLTTVGGLFPTAYGVGGYDSLLVPMTLALAWGLVSGTLLSLIWIPCGYAIIDEIGGFFARVVLRWFNWLFPEDNGQPIAVADNRQKEVGSNGSIEAGQA